MSTVINYYGAGIFLAPFIFSNFPSHTPTLSYPDTQPGITAKKMKILYFFSKKALAVYLTCENLPSKEASPSTKSSASDKGKTESTSLKRTTIMTETQKQETLHTAEPTTSQLVVSNHAVEQFIQRANSRRSPEAIAQRLIQMVQDGREVRKKNAAMSLIKNGFAEARYFNHGSWVVVVVDQVITTCYQAKLRNYLPVAE